MSRELVRLFGRGTGYGWANSVNLLARRLRLRLLYAKHTCTYARWGQHLQKANHLSRCFTCGMPMWQLAGRVSLTLGPSSSASWPTPFGTRGACPRIYLSSLQSSVWRNSNQSYTYIIIVCTLLYRYVPLYDTVTLICDRRRRSNPNDKPVSEPFLPCL